MNVASGLTWRARLEQVQRAVGVDREVRLRVRRRPVVRRLRGGVDDELEVARRRSNSARTPSASRMSRSTRGGTRRELVEQALGRAGGRGLRPEEPSAHVVLDADHVVAGPDEVRHRLGADQPAGARDDHGRHGASMVSSGSSERRPDGSLVARDPLERVRQHRARVALRPPARDARTARGSRRGRCAGRRGGRPRPGRSGTLAPGQLAAELGRLAQRQRDVAPAADVDVRARPALGVARAARRSARPGPRRAAGRAPACPAAVADVAQLPAEVVGQHPVGEDALVDLAHLPRARRSRRSG